MRDEAHLREIQTGSEVLFQGHFLDARRDAVRRKRPRNQEPGFEYKSTKTRE